MASLVDRPHPRAGLIRQDHPKTDAGWRTVVLPSAAGTLRSPANFRRQWRKARKDTGFEWVTPHSFRKAVATLLDRERSDKHAAAQLGHSSTTVTRAHCIAKAHQAPGVSDVLEQLGGQRRRV